MLIKIQEEIIPLCINMQIAGQEYEKRLIFTMNFLAMKIAKIYGGEIVSPQFPENDIPKGDFSLAVKFYVRFNSMEQIEKFCKAVDDAAKGNFGN